MGYGSPCASDMTSHHIPETFCGMGSHLQFLESTSTKPTEVSKLQARVKGGGWAELSVRTSS